MHEHTTIDLSGVKQTDDTNLNCFDHTLAEFQKLYAKGVRNIVDMTVVGMHPNPLYVQEISRKSGLEIIQATGFYTERFLPPFVEHASIEELAAFMVREIRRGIAGTTVKAGIIGELGASKGGLTPNERKVFQAAAIAHQETNVPIATHATLGLDGKEQIELFQESNVDMTNVLISHIDLSGDTSYALSLLDQGVYIGFDTVGKENYQPDTVRAEMILAIERAGFINRIVLSMDVTRQSNMEHRGGIGYSYLLDSFLPLMLEYGIAEDSIEQMLITNPRRFFGVTI